MTTDHNELQLRNLAALSKRLTELAREHNESLLKNTALNHKLREEENARVEMLSEIAHELKKPLAVIRASLPKIESVETAAARSKLIESLDGEVARAAEILDDMIRLSRIELRELSEPTDLQLSELCHEILQQSKLKYPQHEWSAKISPKLRITAAPENIYAILENLLENAAKYSPAKSKIQLTGKQQADKLILAVSDTGPGLSQTDKEHILEAFYRGSAAKQTTGGGLGLTIVQRAVQSLGGQLSIESEKGSGSTFKVALPTNSTAKS